MYIYFYSSILPNPLQIVSIFSLYWILQTSVSLFVGAVFFHPNCFSFFSLLYPSNLSFFICWCIFLPSKLFQFFLFIVSFKPQFLRFLVQVFHCSTLSKNVMHFFKNQLVCGPLPHAILYCVVSIINLLQDKTVIQFYVFRTTSTLR